MSRTDMERDAMGEAMLQMGAIVALSSDLYSSLPHARSSDYEVHRDLAYLMEELVSLESQLGGLGAYRDMVFLMEHITRDSRVAAESFRLQPVGPRQLRRRGCDGAAHRTPQPGSPTMQCGTPYSTVNTSLARFQEMWR